jgi:phage/plasmid-associated DNA primase
MAERKAVLRFPQSKLEIGSDNEIAAQLRAELLHAFGHVVHDLGGVHVWSGDHWRRLDQAEMWDRIRRFDGVRPAEGRRIRLNRARIESIRYILEGILDQPGFFDAAPPGINCRSGFVTFDTDGKPSVAAHDPSQRQLHRLEGRWTAAPREIPETSLLAKLLQGCFQGDVDAQDKIDILAEAAGAAALGISTRLASPKAVILFGPKAENGKSQVLDLLRALLPETAHTAVSPARIGDDRYAVQLAGPLLNATDELGEAAIFSDGFKSAVTGDWMTGRDVYRPAIRFRPRALHMLACNALPAFRGGMDAGVRRRLLVITFNRRIPEGERIEGIGRLTGQREPDLLLAWAIAGAARLMCRRYHLELGSSREAVAEWVLSSDPVGGWLQDRDEVNITGDPRDVVHSKAAYARFRMWANSEGIAPAHVPAKAQFTLRIGSSGVPGLEAPRRAKGHVFVGMRLARQRTHNDGTMNDA